jgi:uncharacterized protein (DUF3820 family)
MNYTEYKIPFGKYRAVSLKDIPDRELKKYLEYLKHPWTNKKPKVKEAISMLEQYLNQSRSSLSSTAAHNASLPAI